MSDDILYYRHILRFKHEGLFKILMLGDTHGCAQGRDCFDTQIKDDVDRLIAATSPDLILLAGDITGGRRGIKTEAELRAFLDWFMPAVERHAVPWAHVYGNHDCENGNDPPDPGVPNAVQQAIYESYPHCVSKSGPADIHGVGNYILPVLASDSDEPRFIIWGLDSGKNSADLEREYGFSRALLPSMGTRCFDGVRPDQVRWYYGVSHELEERFGRKIPGLMYFHIPLPEHALVIQNPAETHMTGTYADYMTGAQLFASAVNPGLFAAVLERGDVRGIYCAHAHNTDFEGVYCGVKLGSDGAISHTNSGVDDIWRGGRLFCLGESDPGAFTTRFVRVSQCV